MTPAVSLYSVRFALGYPAIDALRFHLGERRGLFDREQFAGGAANRTCHSGGTAKKPLPFEGNNFNSAFLY